MKLVDALHGPGGVRERPLISFAALWALGLAIAGLSSGRAVASVPYAVTDLGPGEALAINASGQVVGRGADGKPFLYQDGVRSDLSARIGLEGATVNDINDRGEMVGGFDFHGQSPDGDYTVRHAYLYSNGTVQDIGALVEDYYRATFGVAHQSSEATRLNNRGEIIGSAGSWFVDNPFGSSGVAGFLYSGGAVRDYPDGAHSDPILIENVSLAAINDQGTVVGTKNTISPPYDDSYTSSFSAIGPIPSDFFWESFSCGINNSGKVVGGGANDWWYKPFWTFGADLPLPLEVSSQCDINDAGQIVIDTIPPYTPPLFYDGTDLFDLKQLLPAGSDWSLEVLNAINGAGQIVGRGGLNGETHALLLSPDLRLLDPVPGLLFGRRITPALTADQAVPGQPYLADSAKGRPVFGVAADGVAQLVLRIPATTAGERFSLQLAAGQCADPAAASCSAEYGRLFDPHQPSADLFGAGPATPLEVAAVATDQGPAAFAAFRAPLDFARAGVDSDLAASKRIVTVNVASLENGARPDLAITVVRPPVLLIHDGFANPTAFAGFEPLTPGTADVIGEGVRPFSVGALDYSQFISAEVEGTVPEIPAGVPREVRRNAVGAAYNAPLLLEALRDELKQFSIASRPADFFGFLTGDTVGPASAHQLSISPTMLPVAAVQADVVAHGLGGIMARAMSRVGTLYNGLPFSGSANYGQGYFHKLITLGTPHLGSSYHSRILSEDNRCVWDLAARNGNLHLQSVLINGVDYPGASADQQGFPAEPLSPTLAQLQTPADRPLRTALIAGQFTDANDSPEIDAQAAVEKNRCGTRTLVPGDFLADRHGFTSWPDIFDQLPSDVLVAVESAAWQQPGYTLLPGVVHGAGVAGIDLYGDQNLGFQGPHLLDPASGAAQVVVDLLNEKTNDDTRFVDLP